MVGLHARRFPALLADQPDAFHEPMVQLSARPGALPVDDPPGAAPMGREFSPCARRPCVGDTNEGGYDVVLLGQNGVTKIDLDAREERHGGGGGRAGWRLGSA